MSAAARELAERDPFAPYLCGQPFEPDYGRLNITARRPA